MREGAQLLQTEDELLHWRLRCCPHCCLPQSPAVLRCEGCSSWLRCCCLPEPLLPLLQAQAAPLGRRSGGGPSEAECQSPGAAGLAEPALQRLALLLLLLLLQRRRKEAVGWQA